VENGYIESFNGRLRDECLNGEILFDLADAREKLERWRRISTDLRRGGREASRRVRPRAFLIMNTDRKRCLARANFRTGGSTRQAKDSIPNPFCLGPLPRTSA
jgi:transposase InsO family protein